MKKLITRGLILFYLFPLWGCSQAPKTRTEKLVYEDPHRSQECHYHAGYEILHIYPDEYLRLIVVHADSTKIIEVHYED